MKKMRPTTIDEYINNFPMEVRGILEKLRKTIRDVAPDSAESISYNMPTFKLNGRPLVYFAAFKKHIGFYPLPSSVYAFKDELSAYEQGKGSIRFPLDKQIPYNLIRKIVRFRVKENIGKAKGGG